MSERVYIVMGSAGEYSDRSEWPVAAYLDRASADQHEWAAKQEYERLRKLASDYEDDHGDYPDGWRTWWDDGAVVPEWQSKYDSEMNNHTHNYRVDYYVMEAPLLAKFD